MPTTTSLLRKSIKPCPLFYRNVSYELKLIWAYWWSVIIIKKRMSLYVFTLFKTHLDAVISGYLGFFTTQKNTAWQLIITIRRIYLHVAGGYVDMKCPGSSRTFHTPRLNNIHSLSNASVPKLPCQTKMSPHLTLAVDDRIKQWDSCAWRRSKIKK